MNEDELRAHQARMLAHAEQIIERNEFSVCEFFVDGTHKYVIRFVSAQEAIYSARKRINSLEARSGVVARIIITDGGDSITFEWRHGKGITFPEFLAPGSEDKKDMS